MVPTTNIRCVDVIGLEDRLRNASNCDEVDKMNARRGYVPEDERNFSLSALEVMRTASLHVDYLINEGYDLKSASTFVGNHFLLSERQRLAIMRCLATKEQLEYRKAKETFLLHGRNNP